MSTLSQGKILLLGYPIDRLSHENLEEELVSLIEAYTVDQIPKYATSITALVLGKLSGIFLNRRILPQVADALRNADFVGIDSKELQILARMLGNNVEALIRPEDLLLASASLLAKYRQSLFILGGNEDLLKKVEERLVLDFPGLKIAGMASSSIFTKGLELYESIQTDDLIVELINNAKPTILALNLGHPKQEIWLSRVRNKLNVPLIIGVGGAFKEYLEKKGVEVPSLSFSIGKANQKIVSIFRYLFWLPPLLIFNTFNRIVYNLFYKRYKKSETNSYLFLSKKETLFIVKFPPFVNRNTWKNQLKVLEGGLEHENIILDFTEVRHINPSGMGLLHAIQKEIRAKNKNLFFMGIIGDVRFLLKLNGAWDLVAPFSVSGPEEVLQRMSLAGKDNLLKNRIFLSMDQKNNQKILSFFGCLQGYDVNEESGFNLEPVIIGKSLVIDLAYCTSISNLGFGFLLYLREFQKKQNLGLSIKNANKSLKSQFKYYGLDAFFHFL